MQLFVMTYWCEWDENWIHFKLIVENISEKEGGGLIKPGTAERNGKQGMGMSCRSQYTVKQHINIYSHNNFN